MKITIMQTVGEWLESLKMDNLGPLLILVALASFAILAIAPIRKPRLARSKPQTRRKTTRKGRRNAR